MKTDYSHIPPRVYNHLSGNRTKTRIPIGSNSELCQSMRVSIQKAESIGQQHYKQAMKHVQKFNKYHREAKQKNQLLKNPQDPQCIFKPQLYRNSYTKKLQKHLRSHSIDRPGTNFLTTSFESKSQKPLEPQIAQIHGFVSAKYLSIASPKMRVSHNNYKTAERLLNWGKNRDMKNLRKTVDSVISPERSVSKSNSSYSRTGLNVSRVQTEMRNQKVYRKKWDKKLALNLSAVIDQAGRQGEMKNTPNNYRSMQVSMNISPKTNWKMFSETPQSINQPNNKQKLTSDPSTFRSYNQYGQSLDTFRCSKQIQVGSFGQHIVSIEKDEKQEKWGCYGERLLAEQTRRGENEFYLRQARANIKKNYREKGTQKDLLVKDRAYGKKFSITCAYQPQKSKGNLHKKETDLRKTRV